MARAHRRRGAAAGGCRLRRLLPARTRFPEIEEESIQAVEEAVNPAAIIAWLAGAGVAQVTPLAYMPPLLGLLSASLVYIGVRKLAEATDLPLYRAPDGSSTETVVPADD